MFSISKLKEENMQAQKEEKERLQKEKEMDIKDLSALQSVACGIIKSSIGNPNQLEGAM